MNEPRRQARQVRQARRRANRQARRQFARVERVGVRAGVTLMLAGFALYVGGVMEPYVSIATLVSHWGLPSHAFIQQTGLPTGWQWVELLAYSDMLALGGLVVLSSVIVAAYASLLVAWLRRGHVAYLVLVALQLAVFLLAASGRLGAGH